MREAMEFYREISLKQTKNMQPQNHNQVQATKQNPQIFSNPNPPLNLHYSANSNFPNPTTNIWSQMMSRVLTKNSFEITETLIDDLLTECVFILNKIEHESVNQNKEKEIQTLLKNIHNEQSKMNRFLNLDDLEIRKKMGRQAQIDDSESSLKNPENMNFNFSDIVPGILKENKFSILQDEKNKNKKNSIFDFRDRPPKQKILNGEFVMKIYENQMFFEDYAMSKNFLNKDYVLANELALEKIISEVQNQVLAEFSKETHQLSKQIVEQEIFVKD